MSTVMASFTGRKDIDASRGNNQPAFYTVYISVMVGADAYVRTKSNGNTGGLPRVAPPQSSSIGVPCTTAGRLYSPSDIDPVPHICLKRLHDIIIVSCDPFLRLASYCFMYLKLGQVDFTFVRVAPTGETEPMGEHERPMAELDIQHATGTTGYHASHDHRQRRIRKVPNTFEALT